MIKLKSIIEFIRYIWKSKSKRYLLIYLYSNKEKTFETFKVEYFDSLRDANKRAIEIIGSGEALLARICLEVSVIKSIVEIKK